MNLDAWHMARALELAELGRGYVEPNPLVGCIVVQGAEVIGEGWHRRFGGPHAEIDALAVAGHRAKGGTLVVTLEPCCHWGKTPPCTKAVIAAGIRRVVVAQRDPFPAVSGGGIDELRTAGIEVEVGVREDEARILNAPYLKLLATGRPWIIAKWAMSLDGKLATRTGHSQWISGDKSRRVVHAMRGRVDAVLVGRGTVEADDPLLTARPVGPRVATRVVLDSRATLSSDSQLVRTVEAAPVLVVAGPEATDENIQRLQSAGCEVLVCPAPMAANRLEQLLDELGRRRMTNVLVEGGSQVLGSLHDGGYIDEVHVFIAPKFIGGHNAPSPVAGTGREQVLKPLDLEPMEVQELEGDVYVRGHVRRE
jgi:diaminohydroxyphosphoribosylaminopyrimidine deaminase/5-amino-6-(5-phosphoribosylamino)uracil reductase